MAINKFQRSRLTFDLSAMLLILESHHDQYFLTNLVIGPIELKFHVETPYAKLV